MTFEEICIKYGLENNKLTRDYFINPLQKGENISGDDLQYVFIDMNLGLIECIKIFNTSMYKVRHSLFVANIKKDPILQQRNRERFCLESHGVINPSCLDEVKEKRRKTNLDRYGCNNSSQNPDIKAKTLQTVKERYGGNAPACNKKVLDKIKETNLKKYGSEWSWEQEKFKEKRKQIWMNKYGVDNPFKDESVRNKCRNTLKEKYGRETIGRFGTEEHNKVILEKYGVDHIARSKKIQEKIKQTNLKKYGVSCILALPENQEKAKQGVIAKYGVECTFEDPIILKKAQEGRARWRKSEEYKETRKEMTIHAWETHKKNGTCNTSKDEEKISQLLNAKFDDVKRNYKSEEYPFHCDFYIPSQNLYIEYQGFWTHGKEPFIGTTEQNQRINDFKLKTTEINYKNQNKTMYETAISVWAIRDPLKRETARKNNLNWMEFFTMDEFMAWYNSLN